MNTKIMKDLLARLNEKLKRKKRITLLLMDYAPCHPPSIADSIFLQFGGEKISPDLIVLAPQHFQF